MLVQVILGSTEVFNPRAYIERLRLRAPSMADSSDQRQSHDPDAEVELESTVELTDAQLQRANVNLPPFVSD
eukprot:SAG31_NODE_471_length_15238_cov_14.684554_5_plen_72_part_00